MADDFRDEMMRRTKAVAVDVVFLAPRLKKGPARRNVLDQMIRSATSVGANYRSACRARTKKEFASKLGIVLEEADEVLYWLEVAVAVDLLDRDLAAPIWRHTNEVVRILVSSIRSMKADDGELPPYSQDDPRPL